MKYPPRSAFRGILGLALTIASCGEGPTEPSGPFRLTVLPGFGTPSSPYYNDLPYGSYAYAIDPAGRAVGMAERAEPREFYGAALWPVDEKPISFVKGDEGWRAQFANGRRF